MDCLLKHYENGKEKAENVGNHKVPILNDPQRKSLCSNVKKKVNILVTWIFQ